jgi:chaperonin GroEL
MNEKNNKAADLNSSFENTGVMFGMEAHEEILRGASILAEAVKVTMGPAGQTVIISKKGSKNPPFITKDGVTVAKAINSSHPVQSIGVELIKEVAAVTNEQAGDGTTTATVLAYALLEKGFKMLTTGHQPVKIKHGMEIGCKAVVEELKKFSKPVTDLEDIISIGTISANGDRQIGSLLSDAISKVGQDGIITIEVGKSFNTSLEIVEGIQIESGFCSPYFVTNNEKNTAELQNPLFLITNKKISTLSEILPILEETANNNKSLVIVADEIEGEALHTLIVNKMNGVLNVVAVKAPSYGENRTNILQDLATVTNSTVFDASSGQNLENVNLEQLGTCSKVIISRNSMTIVTDGISEEQKSKINDRIVEMRTALKEDNLLDDLRRHNLKKRLAKLGGGVAVIKVGGATEVEIFEKKDRVEDALNATLAAVQEGVISGGGTGLYYASKNIRAKLKTEFESQFDEDEMTGIKIVLDACEEPIKTIVRNSGKSWEVILDKLLSFNDQKIGYDAHKNEYKNLVEAGIIDPVKVPRFAIEHATSVVSLMLSCNAIVVSDIGENKTS